MNTKDEKRLAELTEKKKSAKLDDNEFKEFKELLSKCKGNTKRQNGKGKGSKKEEVAFKPGNSFTWWSKIPELINDCANFKSNYIAGRPLDSGFIPYVTPGVLEVLLDTCYHPGNIPTDAVNVWARDLYLRMFQKYRPASGYTASDLGIAILAGLEAVKLIAYYERIYGVINRYSVRNINMPTVEASGLGLTTAQLNYLQGHLSDFRYDLNFLIRKAQRLCLPKDIALIDQAISLFGYEYLDHDSPRAQIIIFTLNNYGVYQDTAVSAGGSIEFSDTVVTDLFDFSADNMCKALDHVLSALLGSDSIQRIYADLVVWFGEASMLQFLPVPEDYVVVPVYSEEILHEVHNLESMFSSNYVINSVIDGALSSADQAIIGNGYYHVYQVDDIIVTAATLRNNLSATPQPVNIQGRASYVLCTSGNVLGLENAHVIDGYKVDPDPEFVVEGTMFKACLTEIEPQANFFCGIIASAVSYLVRGLDLHYTTGSNGRFGNLEATQTAALSSAGLMAVLDWAPLTYHVVNQNLVYEVYGDIDVPISITRSDLTKVQRTAYLSGIKTDVQPIKN